MTVRAAPRERARPAPPRAAEGRLWEVDVARTAGIVMMVVYHSAYDVQLLGPGLGVDAGAAGWRALQIATGSSFLFLVGVSLAISNARGRARGQTGLALYRRHARRAAQVAAAALLVSVGTFVAVGDDYVRFGILHCIAAAMLIGPLLLPLGRWNLALAGAVLATGLAVLATTRSGVPGLLVLGVWPEHGMIDWYPLLPWLAPMLVGLAAGRALYPGGRRGPWGRRLPTSAFARRLGAPGRHSLPIYLVHQPLLLPLVGAVLALSGVGVSWRV